MAKASDFRLYDPVEFSFRDKTLTGHIGRKTRSRATVKTEDESEYNVPWALLSPHRAGSRRRVSLAVDEAKSQFRPDDKVSFPSQSVTLQGVISRLGPKRALIVAEGGRSYRVPYALLTHVGLQSVRGDAQRLSDVSLQAERLIARHRLAGWSFQLDDAPRRAGSCSYETKLITLSRLYCLHASDEEVRDTILHEIAHALVGPDHHHDKVWKAKARSIGCTAERCHQTEFAPPLYILSCPTCGWRHKSNVRRRNIVCKHCRRRPRREPFTRQAWERVSP